MPEIPAINCSNQPVLGSGISFRDIVLGCGLLFVVAVVSSCSPGAIEQCTNHSAKYYSDALSAELKKEGVPHSFSKDRGVCFSSLRAANVAIAALEVDRNLFAVIELLQDECQERAFVDWANNSSIPFQIEASKTSDGIAGKHVFVMFSFTAEDVDRNKRRLVADAPKNVNCSSSK